MGCVECSSPLFAQAGTMCRGFCEQPTDMSQLLHVMHVTLSLINVFITTSELGIGNEGTEGLVSKLLEAEGVTSLQVQGKEG